MHPRIQHLILHPFEVQLNDVALLQDEIEKYPYFSTLRTLLLFGLKEFDHDSYQAALKKTSIHCPSRVALFHYLQKEKQAPTDEATPTSEDEFVFASHQKAVELAHETAAINPTETTIEPTEEITEQPKETPAEFTFSEWLNLPKKAKNTTETPAESTPSERDIKYKLIDEFIEKAPKISAIPPHIDPKITVKPADHSTEFSDLMTETLAQIYVEQKMFDKAIRAYKILALKYPEKSEDFEDKINSIELQKNA